jgi:hypothetical protein
MLTDLAALTPPLLVAAAFLIAAGAFLRHEMRRGKNSAEGEEPSDSQADLTASDERNKTDRRSVLRSRSDDTSEEDRDSDGSLPGEIATSLIVLLPGRLLCSKYAPIRGIANYAWRVDWYRLSYLNSL